MRDTFCGQTQRARASYFPPVPHPKHNPIHNAFGLAVAMPRRLIAILQMIWRFSKIKPDKPLRSFCQCGQNNPAPDRNFIHSIAGVANCDSCPV